MPIAVRDGRLYGPGTFDMKAGITIAMVAARALAEVGPQPDLRIVMLWTTDEETGSATSRSAVDEEARRSDAVLVLEPSLPGGALKTSRKGGGEDPAGSSRASGPRWRRSGKRCERDL